MRDTGKYNEKYMAVSDHCLNLGGVCVEVRGTALGTQVLLYHALGTLTGDVGRSCAILS